MKAFAFLCVGVSALMIGCAPSNDSSSSLSFQDFKPLEKPQNPAPLSAVTGFFKAKQKASGLMPMAAAVFDTVPGDTKLKYINNESPERKEALAKLNTQGLTLLKVVKSKCTGDEQNPRMQYEGEVKQGSTEKITFSYGLSGAECPVTAKTFEETKNTYTRVEGTSAAYSVDGLITKTLESKFAFTADKYQKLSGLKNANSKTNININAQILKKGSLKTTKLSGIADAALEYNFTNGDVVAGKWKFQVARSFNNVKFEMLLDLQSAQGAMRVVAIQKPNAGQPEIYVNGEQVELSALPGIEDFIIKYTETN